MNLRWTDAGRAALASAAHVGTAAVRLTHLAIGDGSGPGGQADDNRTDLRNERHRAAITGTRATAGRIALRADFAPDASYSITEAGIFGAAGDPAGASQLLLYWTGDGAPAAAAAAGTDLAIAAVIEFQNAVAEVAVTVGDKIVFGVTEPASEAEFGSTRYATGEETGLGKASDRSVTPAGLHSAAGKVVASLLAGEAAPGDGTIYQLKGTADGALIVEERTQDAAASAKIANNAAAITGLANRVTAVEGKLLASLVPAAAAVDKHYVIQRASGANGGGLKIVEAVFRRYVTPGSHNLTVPAGVTRLRVTLVGAGGGGGGASTCGSIDVDDDREPEHGGTSEFAGCNPGSAGLAGGLSAVRRAGAAIVSAAGGAGGRGAGAEAEAAGNSRVPGDPPAGGANGKGGGGDGGKEAPGNIGYQTYGDGGAAGKVKTAVIAVTPKEVLEIVCGAGGAGGIGGRETGSWDTVYPGGPGSAGAGGMVQIVNG